MKQLTIVQFCYVLYLFAILFTVFFFFQAAEKYM